MKENFIKLLNATGIRGMDNLLEMMEEGGFFTAPCSSKYHLCVAGGLVEHSLNVFFTLLKLNEVLQAGLDYTDMVVVALLHDLGKMGDFGKPVYVPKILKSGETSKAEPYKNNPDLIYEEHEIRSVRMASRYIELTEQQVHAIEHHNGSWCKLDNSFSSTWDKHKLSMLLHFADLYCTRFIEEGVNDD